MGMHPRTAFEHLNRMKPYETTHPPLGKVIMAIGVAIFWNESSVGVSWALFGIIMVPVMYLMGKKIFKRM